MAMVDPCQVCPDRQKVLTIPEESEDLFQSQSILPAVACAGGDASEADNNNNRSGVPGIMQVRGISQVHGKLFVIYLLFL